jgi:hypothetical protein
VIVLALHPVSRVKHVFRNKGAVIRYNDLLRWKKLYKMLDQETNLLSYENSGPFPKVTSSVTRRGS